MDSSRSYFASMCIALLLCLASTVAAVPVTLQQGTATNSQGGFSPDQSIDGDTSTNGNGWCAIWVLFSSWCHCY